MHAVALLMAAVLITSGHCQSEQDSMTPYARPVLRSPGVGIVNGTPFDDLSKIAGSVLSIRTISIAAWNEIDSLQLSYSLKDGSVLRSPKHGQGHSAPKIIKLARDEYISQIEGTIVYNHSVSQVSITVSSPNRYKSRVYSNIGMTVGERRFSFDGYILGIHGKVGSYGIVRNMGVYYLTPVVQSEYFGSSDIMFLENPDATFPPVVKINKLSLYHSDVIGSLQAEYQLLNESMRMGAKHGEGKGSLATVTFGTGEVLVGLKGELGQGSQGTCICQLTLISKLKNGIIKTYGPFGKPGDKSFALQGHILGFAGRAGNCVESLSVFYYV